jgi:hypothetical protein
MGERGLLATTAAMLAQALYAQGRADEAEAQCAVSEAAAPRDDLVTHVMWRGVRAKVLARAGHAQAGEALAREAVGLVERTDMLVIHGDALLDLAEVLRLAGRADRATEAASAALAVHERKGNLVAAARARAWLRPRGDGPMEVDDAAVAVRPGGVPGGRSDHGVGSGGAREG